MRSARLAFAAVLLGSLSCGVLVGPGGGSPRNGGGAGGSPGNTGTLQVVSTPAGATVVLDGAATGLVTACDVTNVVAGVHEVLLRLDGYVDFVTEVEVVANETRTVEATLVPLVTAPTTPTDLAVSPGPLRLTVSWTAVRDAASYRLYWTDDGSEPTAASTAVTVVTTQYEHTGLSSAKTYRYRVSAVNEKGESPLSVSVQGGPDPMVFPPPTGLTVVMSGATANLDWDDVTTPGATFSVRRGTSTVASDLGASQFTEPLPDQGVDFAYRVKVVVAGVGESDWSAPVTAWTWKIINESERNGPSSWGSSGSWYFSGNNALGLKHFVLKGGYSGTYAIYQPASYKYYDYDVYKVSVRTNDTVTLNVQRGAGSGLWAMEVHLVCVTTSGGGVLNDMIAHEFTGSGGRFKVLGGVQTCTYNYLDVVMPVDVGASYTYEINVTISSQ
jgi:hypothetical protein